MSVGLLIIQVITYGFALWLGLYLIQRDFTSRHLRYAGLGLLSYAVIVGTDILRSNAEQTETAIIFARIGYPAVIFPAVFWFLAIYELTKLDEQSPTLSPTLSAYFERLPFLAIGVYLLFALTNLAFDYSTKSPETNIGFWLILIFVIPIFLLTLQILWNVRRNNQQARAIVLLFTATLFFALGIGIMLVPTAIISRGWLIVAISLDLLTFGFFVAVLDAFEQGESLRPEMSRGFYAASIVETLFGGQVGLAMVITGRQSLTMLALLLGTMTAAVGLQVFSNSLARLLDRLALADHSTTVKERETLRTEAEVLARQKSDVDFIGMERKEFSRLTRRALRDFSNLPKLASNPLTQLPLVTQRLDEKDLPMNTLERAAELKVLLTEGIEALKPRDDGDYGVNDEWRFYNALYYPYVVGVRPYSRRADHFHLNEDEQEILEWFRVQVPERTLYNWQNKAAALIADNLREKLREPELMA